MELRHLEPFVVLAEELSFTKAAARLHLVQSGLSVSIRNLEKELTASTAALATSTSQRTRRASGSSASPD